MKRRLLPAILLLGGLLLFWIANRGAYRDYFQADSLDNLAFMKSLGGWDLIRPLLIPKVNFDNFRPIGMLFFRWMGAGFGLWFPPYAAALQMLHILNAALLLLLIRRLGLTLLAACAGALFFAFHMALFHVLWEPMFAFDLICGSMCLLSLLAYVNGRWIVSLLLFWLAYRSKEQAIMLPAVLAAYEWLLGKRNWRRLAPFFALSLVLGVQALLNNAVRDSPYTLKFDLHDIWTCIAYYSTQLLLIPYAGLVLIALPLLRDARVRFGFLSFCVLLFPMLLLPARLFGAYLYVPLIALAICMAALAEWKPMYALAAIFVLWIPWNYVNMRWLRKEELARADRTRLYVANIVKAAQQHPDIGAYIYNDAPIEWYAIRAAAELVRSGPGVKAIPIGDPGALKALQSQPVVVLDWQPLPVPGSVVTLAHTAGTPDASYIAMDRRTPVWQLAHGWNLGDRGPFRWIEPHATARLWRPANAKQFELTVNIFPAFLKYVPLGHVRVSLNGHAIGERDFDRPGVEVARWSLDPAPAGSAIVDFETQPGFRLEKNGFLYGLSIGSFGFIPR